MRTLATSGITTSIQAWLTSLIFTLVCLPLAAQTYNGRILGTVADPSGAAVSGASVTITDTQRGTSRTLVTDPAGFYAAPDLSPGLYKLRIEAKGFRTVERTGVVVEVAKDSRVDVGLQTGQVNEVIEVSGEVPLVDSTSSTLGGTLTSESISELPLNGRNYENLLQLRPGVVRYPGGGFSTTSTNGLRAEDNAYLIDGLFNSEPFSGQSIINGAGIAGDSATILPVDAIEEFNVEENPPAEYGWKPGAIVNVALKSGTNQLHGSAYAFGRDTVFDARNYFNTVQSGPKNPRNLEQFGGTAGGAIIKDKLFFFGGYEGQRYTVGNVGQISTPATVSLGGDPNNSVVDAISAVHTAFLSGALTHDVSAASLKIAGCTMSPSISCNGTGFPTNNGNSPLGPTTIGFGLPNTVNADNGVGKVDFHLNDRHTLTSMYFFGNNSGTVSDASQLQTKWLTQIHTRSQVFGQSWTWVPSARWVNQARFGYNRLYQPTFTADHNVPASSYGLDTGVTNPLYGGLPRINVFPFYIFPQELGGFNWPKVQGPDTRFQFVDHLSYTRGKHALKFGGEIHHDAFNGGAYGGSRGRIKFVGGAFDGGNSSGLEDFFAGLPTSGSQLTGDPTRHIHNWGYAFFLQDDWRVTRNLTVNLGLRYEVDTVVKEDHNLIGNFSPTAGLEQVGHQISAPYNGDHNNFAPRLGFAWDVAGDGKTVIRGGGGVIYETINWESFLALNNALGISTIPTGAIINGSGGTAGGSIAVGTVNYPGSSLNWNGPGTVFPTGTINCFANPCSLLGITPNLRTPYVYNWTLGVQHAFTQSLSLEVAYVGDHGAKLINIRDINQVNPQSPAEIACGHCEQAGRPFNAQFPYLSFIYQMQNKYESNYDGLQTTLTSRNFHGLTSIIGYTYAHALDQVGANWDFGAGSGLPTDSIRPGREYGNSDFDIRHRLTMSLTYTIPGKPSFAQLLEGWQLNSIVTLASAQPWGVMDAGNDLSQTGEGVDRWDFVGNPSDFKSGPNPIPCFGFGGAPCNPTIPAACMNAATAAGPGAVASLNGLGCYMQGSSVLIPPAAGTEGTMGRNIFRDSGFRNWDFSVAKNWKFGERLGAQFRAEFFNVLNHPNFANPFGGQNGWAHNDPSVPGPGGFGCGCATPDVAASNPVIGSGGSRAVQLGLKLLF